jgi:hypothetical protein
MSRSLFLSPLDLGFSSLELPDSPSSADASVTNPPPATAAVAPTTAARLKNARLDASDGFSSDGQMGSVSCALFMEYLLGGFQEKLTDSNRCTLATGFSIVRFPVLPRYECNAAADFNRQAIIQKPVPPKSKNKPHPELVERDG